MRVKNGRSNIIPEKQSSVSDSEQEFTNEELEKLAMWAIENPGPEAETISALFQDNPTLTAQLEQYIQDNYETPKTVDHEHV